MKSSALSTGISSQMSEEPSGEPSAKNASNAKTNRTTGKIAKSDGSRVPPPVMIPPRPDLEKGFKDNDNDKVGVIVEIPEKSMQEMLPVIITFFLILACLVPVDIFLALHILNRSTAPGIYTRTKWITDLPPPTPPIPETTTLISTTPDGSAPVNKLQKRNIGDLPDSNEITDNWCSHDVLHVGELFHVIQYDLSRVQELAFSRFTKALVYLMKVYVRVPIASSVWTTFVLPQTKLPKAFEFRLDGFSEGSQTLSVLTLKRGIDASNVREALRENADQWEPISSFPVHRDDAYGTFSVAFILDFSQNTLRLESCDLQNECRFLLEQPVDLETIRNFTGNALYIVQNVDTDLAHDLGNEFGRVESPVIEEKFCCKVYAERHNGRRTTLCRHVEGGGWSKGCTHETIDPACSPFLH